MHLETRRTLLGACVLGLTLLAGCTVTPGDPHDPPPVDPPPPPPPPPPPLEPINAPSDEYDSQNHSVLVADCVNQTLVSIDMATGRRRVTVDDWPWFEPSSTVCVDEILFESSGYRAYAIVNRTFDDPGESGLTCIASELVVMDTGGNRVHPIETLDQTCCDDCGDAGRFYSLQIDRNQARLLALESDCTPDHCDYALSGAPFDWSGRNRLHALYPVACYPDDEGCDYSYTTADALRIDPLDPDHRVLVLATPSTTGVAHIDSIDLETGVIIESIPIQTDWAGIQLGFIADLSVDDRAPRVYLTMAGQGPDGNLAWGVVAIDRDSGEQFLLYDGAPTAGGRTLSCTPNASFDSRQRRLVLVEPPGGYGCQDSVFTVDAETGEFASL